MVELGNVVDVTDPAPRHLRSGFPASVARGPIIFITGQQSFTYDKQVPYD